MSVICAACGKEITDPEIARLRSVVTVRDEALRALNAYNDRLRADLEIFTASSAGLTDDVLALRAINAELLAALKAVQERFDADNKRMRVVDNAIAQAEAAGITKAKGETP